MTNKLSQNSLAKTLGQIQSITDLGDALLATAEEFDIDKVAVTSVPTTTSRKLSDHVMWSSLSPQLLYDYDQQEMLSCSTHFEALRQSVQPRIWQTDMIDEYVITQSAQNIERTQEFLFDHSISMGFSFPVMCRNGSKGAVMFMGDRDNLDDLSLAYLHTISSYAYELISELTADESRPNRSLTKRESEILTWVANGKTSNEISLILNVSDHTVNAHLHSAMKKMDCVNRPQLVAKALRLGAIS